MSSLSASELPSFEKQGKVSVWCSSVSYDTIPESYFVEDEQGLDAWAKNFNISHYDPDNMETNGVESGTAFVRDILGPCSYSSAFGELVVHKVNKMGHQQVSWIILLFDFEYRNKLTKIHEDEIVQYVGSFVYDMDAITLDEQDEFERQRQEAQTKLEAEAAALVEPELEPESEPEPESEQKITPKPGANNPWLKS
jgi:hypothetical protein